MPSTDPVHLPGGLELRTATAADQSQVEDLLTDRGEADDAQDHRLVMDDPDAGYESCAVVVDGDRVVSTATLLDETVRIGRGSGAVTLGAGQVELVATLREYEGRGLVRALMTWAHRRSTERGHLLQVMLGIPYFYRLFGYEYAIDIPPAAELRSVPQGSGRSTLRAADEADLPAVVALHEAAQAAADVAMPHSTPRWRWLLARDGSTQWVLERDGSVVGTARTHHDDESLVVAEAAARDSGCAADLLAALSDQSPGGPQSLTWQRRPGLVDQVAAAHYIESDPDIEQYYVRIPDLAAMLDALRPLLWSRHVASGLDRSGRSLLISTFGAHVALEMLDDGLGRARRGGVMQAPGAAGGMGCAPDRIGALLVGPLGLAGLSRRFPDVYAGGDREWYEALFPPMTADLLTFYLPY